LIKLIIPPFGFVVYSEQKSEHEWQSKEQEEASSVDVLLVLGKLECHTENSGE